MSEGIPLSPDESRGIDLAETISEIVLRVRGKFMGRREETEMMSLPSADHPEKPQLHMVWPARAGVRVPDVRLAPGYSLRTFHSRDEQAFLDLVALSDFDPWDATKLSYNLNRALPDGWFFVTEDKDRGQIVATAMCLHNYSGLSPFTGDIGWVFCRPEHRGKSLGFSLCVQAVRRFLDAGYADIQLHTEYHRLAAIKTYLRLGFVPRITSIDSEEVAALWEQVCTKVGLPFERAKWQRLDGDGESVGLAESIE